MVQAGRLASAWAWTDKPSVFNKALLEQNRNEKTKHPIFFQVQILVYVCVNFCFALFVIISFFYKMLLEISHTSNSYQLNYKLFLLGLAWFSAAYCWNKSACNIISCDFLSF